MLRCEQCRTDMPALQLHESDDTHRLITIAGPPSQIETCKQLICEILMSCQARPSSNKIHRTQH